MRVRSVLVSEFEQMMLDGVVRDGCTLAAWALYLYVEGAALINKPRYMTRK